MYDVRWLGSLGVYARSKGVFNNSDRGPTRTQHARAEDDSEKRSNIGAEFVWPAKASVDVEHVCA